MIRYNVVSPIASRHNQTQYGDEITRMDCQARDVIQLSKRLNDGLTCGSEYCVYDPTQRITDMRLRIGSCFRNRCWAGTSWRAYRSRCTGIGCATPRTRTTP
jgi:hypothetical protein